MVERPLHELDIALAIMRGRDFRRDFDPTTLKQHTALQYGQAFDDLLRTCHSKMFQDMYKDYVTQRPHNRMDDPMRPGSLDEPWKNPILRHEMNYLAKKLFDGAQMKADIDELPEILAESYIRLKKIQPFAYGNGMTLGLFMSAVTELAHDRHIFFDTRRLSMPDHEMLATIDQKVPNINQLYGHVENKDERIKDAVRPAMDLLVPIFTQALDSSIVRNPPRKEIEKWPPLPDSSVEIGGLRFLMQQRGGDRYLITVNGGLVPLNKPDHTGLDLETHLNRHIASEHLIDTFRVRPTDDAYLPIARPEAGKADGVSLAKGEPLACLNVNPLTGLTGRYNKRLSDFLDREKPALLEAGIISKNSLGFIDLATPKVAEALRGRLADGDSFRQVLDTAVEHASAMMHIVNTAVDKAFEGKTSPAAEGNAPQFIMSQGGAASGKSNVESHAEKLCGNNYVTASLDAARENFQLYEVMLKAGHHADDYAVLAPVATLIRENIARRAYNEGYNLLYDGTGIPYGGKYDKLIATYHDKKFPVSTGGLMGGDSIGTDAPTLRFQTSVVGVDAMLYVPEERKGEFGASTPERKQMRFKATGRTLPDNEMYERHEQAAKSFLAAAFDSKVDTFKLYDNAGAPSEESLLAQRFAKVDAATKDALNEAQREGRLMDKVKELGWMPPLVESPKEMTEKGISFVLNKQGKDEYTVLMVYDTSRFIDLVRKSHLNERPVGYEALPYLDDVSNWLVQHGVGDTNGRGSKADLKKPLSHADGVREREEKGPAPHPRLH